MQQQRTEGKETCKNVGVDAHKGGRRLFTEVGGVHRPEGRIHQEEFFPLNGRSKKASIQPLCGIIKDADAKDSLIRFFNY